MNTENTTLSKWARPMPWVVLTLVSVAMMTGYIVSKEMSPLQYFLEASRASGGMEWTSTEFGFFAGSKGFFNVFLLMLFVGGVVLDRFGVRVAGVLSMGLMIVGSGSIYLALTSSDPTATVSLPLLSDGALKRQVVFASLGFATFGVGYEMFGITVSKVIVHWFSGSTMALAMGLQVSLARLGTALALAGSPALAKAGGLTLPIVFGVVSLGVGLLLYLIFCAIDRKHRPALQSVEESGGEGFSWKSLRATLSNRGFWLITLLCLFYYSSLYPFLDFATKLMISKYGVEPELAGTIPAILPFTSIVLTPLFGYAYDRWGYGTPTMIIGSVMLTLVMAGFALPMSSAALAVTLMVVLGIAFSLLPSVLWPAVPKLVPIDNLGTAYSVIYYIQNIGLMLVPVLIGWLLQRSRVGESVDFTSSMWVFAFIGLCACVSALLLHHYMRDKLNR